MNDIFQNLKETMDETVLKDIDFNEQHKRKIRKSAMQTSSKKKFFVKPKLDFMLSTAVISILVLGVGYFSADQIGLFKEEKHSANLEKAQVPKKSAKPKPQESSIYTPPEKKESYEDMTKEEVQFKLLNSTDYFDTASGKFEEHTVYYDHSESTSEVEYKVSFKEKIIGVITDYSKQMKVESRLYYNDQKEWYFTEDPLRGKIYWENKNEYQVDHDAITLEDIHAFDEDGLDLMGFRNTPPVGLAGSTLFPHRKTVDFTKNKKLWKIEKQNEELLGHNTIVLKGKLNLDDRYGLIADSFRFWVDKDTGILVKYETYDENGKLTSYLHPERLEVNVPVDTKELQPKFDGYEKFVPEGMFYKDDREKDIRVVIGAEVYEKELNKVLNVLHKNIPYLYEFSHPDLQMFSASYEKYKEDKHGYLSYSYKKPKNEQGSGSKMLFIRTYPKDTVVRSWGEFDTERGKRLGEVSVNGIDWEYYEVKGRPDYHYFGESGNYAYEILSQDINPKETNELLKYFKKSQ